MKTPNPIPTEGQYFTRTNRGSSSAARYAERPTDLVRIGPVNAERKEFEIQRVDGFNGAEPIIGRRTTMSFETWTGDSARFTPTTAPVPTEEPAPDSGVQTANTTEARWAAIEASLKSAHAKLDTLLAQRGLPLFEQRAR